MVQIAGIRVGRVDDMHDQRRPRHRRLRRQGRRHGGARPRRRSRCSTCWARSTSSSTPKGSGTDERRRHHPGRAAPTAATTSSPPSSELTTTTEPINIPPALAGADHARRHHQRRQPAHPVDASPGSSRLSQAIATPRRRRSRRCSAGPTDVTKLLAERRGDLVTLMKQRRPGLQGADRAPRRHPRRCWSTPTSWPSSCAAWPPTTRPRSSDALKQLDTTLTFLRGREKQLNATLTNLGPYASILINIIGTGPWFDAYVPNLASIATRRVHTRGSVRSDEPSLRKAPGRRRGRCSCSSRPSSACAAAGPTASTSPRTSTAPSASTRAPRCG